MMMRLAPLVLALVAGTASADELTLFNGDLVLILPDTLTVGRTFGDDTDAGIYATDLISPSISDAWIANDREAELADMDHMEAAFGLSFPSPDCVDYAANANVLPTRCKQTTGMSILAIPRTADDSGQQLGVQLGLEFEKANALWDGADYDQILTLFCDNESHAHRKEVSRDAQSVVCISNRPALAPHFLSFRMLIDADYALIMYAQNTYAETDVIMTFGVDPFLELISAATDIESTLFNASEDYVASNGFEETYLIDLVQSVTVK